MSFSNGTRKAMGTRQSLRDWLLLSRLVPRNLGVSLSAKSIHFAEPQTTHLRFSVSLLVHGGHADGSTANLRFRALVVTGDVRGLRAASDPCARSDCRGKLAVASAGLSFSGCVPQGAPKKASASDNVRGPRPPWAFCGCGRHCQLAMASAPRAEPCETSITWIRRCPLSP